MSPLINEILKLSVPERILLVEAIWDSVVNENQGKKPYQLSEEQILILNEELQLYAQSPEKGSTWEEVKKRIRDK